VATSAENLQTMLDEIDAQLLTMTASPKPTYSIDGMSVSWGDHFKTLMEARKTIRELLILEEGPAEARVQMET
jgi:hypothetical protein